MILYHLLGEDAYSHLLRKGYVKGDGRRVMRELKEPYQWLVREMHKRIPSTKKDKYPVWAWYYPKPDLRWSGLFGPPKTKAWRLEIELPDEHVLLSDYNLWHLPLNGGYISETPDEEWPEDGSDPPDLADFDRRLKEAGIYHTHYSPRRKLLPEPFYSELLKTWEKVLDCENSTDIQATFWKFTLDDVRSATPFISR